MLEVISLKFKFLGGKSNVSILHCTYVNSLSRVVTSAVLIFHERFGAIFVLLNSGCAVY